MPPDTGLDEAQGERGHPHQAESTFHKQTDRQTEWQTPLSVIPGMNLGMSLSSCQGSQIMVFALRSRLLSSCLSESFCYHLSTLYYMYDYMLSYVPVSIMSVSECPRYSLWDE